LSTVNDSAPRGIDMVTPVIRRPLTALLGWRYDAARPLDTALSASSRSCHFALRSEPDSSAR